MSLFGSWVERLEAIAAGRELVAVAGKRDAGGVTTSQLHVFPVTLLDGKGTGWSLDAGAALAALAFAGDALLLAGGEDGVLAAWDVTGQRRVATLALAAPIRAIALDADVARGDGGTLAVGTADGALHLVRFAIQSGTPRFTIATRHALSDGAIGAVAFDPAGLWVAGGADGQLRIIGADVRTVTPGGDGGIRAIVCLGDGRVAIGSGDGSIRFCFVVGEVEPQDRSGDHGHEGAVRGLVQGPVVVDETGRDQPRRLFSVGEDRALKCWFVDGNRRPRTIELAGAATAIAFVSGPVAKLDKAAGRLWIASAQRKAFTIALGPEADPVGDPVAIGSALDRLEAELRDAKAAVKVKLEAVATLATLAEDEARILLDLALATAPPEVRVAATQAMVRSKRQASRPALRAALDAPQPELRGAAFHALVSLETEQPLAAIRAGMAARNEDVRVRAVDALLPHAASVIAMGMIADALRDQHPNVRRRAFAVLRKAVSDPSEAIRIALARGTPDVRAEALLTLGFVVRTSDAPARALAAAAFDDADAGVRTSAFLAAVMQRPRLAARLDGVVPSVRESFQQVAQQLAVALALPVDDGAPLDDDQLEPLFAQLACRSADAAIRGAGCLLALGDPRAVGAVLQLTREADPALRRGATSNLVGALVRWPDDDRLATRLTWLLDDPDAQVRAFAFDALARTAAAGGAAAELDLAETALRTSQEDIRVRALQILVRVGAPGSAVTARADALLGDALDDEAAKVRTEAFRTLWAWHSAEPLVPLERGATSRHGDLRTQVVTEIDRRRHAKQTTAAMDKLLVGLVADPVAAVGLAAYGALTRQPDDGTEVAIPAEVYLAAMASPAPAVRAAGATGAAKATAQAVRARLVELVKDDRPAVHLAAIESLDTVAPTDAEGFALALGSIFWELEVKAGELLGRRRDVRAVAPMQRILAIPKTDLNRPPDVIRQRAAAALALVGDLGSVAFLMRLVDDDDHVVRELAARGLATAAQPGSAPALAALVALLGHEALEVRSWGGEGLAKLGDLRALPVLAGTQRHEHRPLRIGAIVGFVALGSDGVRGLRQGLEDREREIQDLAFAVIVARDVALAAAGFAPDLLVDAMSSPSAEIRFAAARLFERRAAGETLTADVIGELVGPRKPEKATDMKDWPPPPRRAAILQVVADAIASDAPGQRYAAAQVLAVRTQPLTFWREAARLAGPTRGGPAPHTGWSPETRTARRSGWLRRLVGERRDPEATELEGLAQAFLRAGAVSPVDAPDAQRLVFGVYAGLVRQAPGRGEADETHRVRRDAVARLVELAREDAVGVDAVLPVLGHAVGDPHHLVRQAAMAALRSLYPIGALAPLQQAIAGAADLGKAAIDELVGLAETGDDRAAAMVRGALDADDAEVRAYAALRLPRLYPPGSAEPQLLGARSRHGDVRLAAIAQLATATDATPAITDALVAALGSEHADLRLRAAVALAKRGGPASAMGIDVLAALLRSQEHAGEALAALTKLADRPESGAAAAGAIAARLDDDAEGTADRARLVLALGTIGHAAGMPTLARMLVVVPSDPAAAGKLRALAGNVWVAINSIIRDRKLRDTRLPDGRFRFHLHEPLAIQYLGELARAPNTEDRAAAAAELAHVEDRGAEEILAKLLGDRDPIARTAAAEALAFRAEYMPHATLAALEAALRGGRRELVLPAALGLAARKRPEAFQPLLLVVKAGEPPERERALLALGSLGDRRALDHLLPLLTPAPEDEASRALTPAAVEALGRLLPALEGDDAVEIRARVERLAVAGGAGLQQRALTGLRYAGDAPGRGIIERVAADREALDAVRVHAIEQLGLAAAPSSEPVLADLLGDELGVIRAAAATALGKVLGGDRTRVSLHGLGVPYDDVSRPAAAYLSTAGDVATLVARLGAVKSPDVRRMLREGLIRRGALPRAELEAALRGDAPSRAEAAWIAGAAGEAARPLEAAVVAAVGQGLSGWKAAQGGARGGVAKLADETEAWRASLWAARRVASPTAPRGDVEAPATLAIADDKAPVVIRREAAAVLAWVGSPSAVAVLGRAIGDGDRQVRDVATRAVAARAPSAAAIRALGSRADATTIAPLAWAVWPEVAKELVADASTRAWAVTVGLAGKRVAEMIAIASGKGSDAGRLAAIAALGILGGTEAMTTLERIHNDDAEDDVVKLAAWKALKRLLRRAAKTYAEGQDKGPRGAGGGGGGGGDDGDGDGDGDGDEDGDGDADEDGDDDAGGDDDGDEDGDEDEDEDDDGDEDDDE